VSECKALEKRKGQTMNDFEWVIGKDGNVIGSKITNPATGVTTARDLTLDKSGNPVRRDDDAGSLIK